MSNNSRGLSNRHVTIATAEKGCRVVAPTTRYKCPSPPPRATSVFCAISTQTSPIAMALFRRRALSVLLNAAAATGRGVQEDGHVLAAPLRRFSAGLGRGGVFAPAQKLTLSGGWALLGTSRAVLMSRGNGFECRHPGAGHSMLKRLGTLCRRWLRGELQRRAVQKHLCRRAAAE